MIRKALVLSAAPLLAAAISFSAQAQEKVVNVYNWSDYIDPTIIDDFTKETGIKVIYDVFDSNEILETKLLAGGSGYDVVVPTANFLARQIEAGVFQKLDKSKLPNISNMWDVVLDRTGKYDPGNEYSINYMWGTVGLGYNTKKVQEALGVEAIDSWDVFFDPAKLAKLADCGVYVLDLPSDILPTTLKYLGLDPESHSPDDLAKAEEALMKIRPYIRKFHSSEYINALANGDICLAVGWSGDVFQARDRAAEADQGVAIAFAIPKEGAEMWFDQMAIPADAPACRRGARLPQLHDEAGSGGQGFELHLLRQRQQGVAAVHRQGDPRRPGDLSGRGDAAEAVHRVALRSEDAAHHHAHLDQDRHRPMIN